MLTHETTTQPDLWLERYGSSLYRHALIRTGDPAVAEDIVQETLLSAWQHREQFAMRSSEKTWLIGILRHKIADHYRQHSRSRETSVDFDALEQDGSNLERRVFDENGHWRQDLSKWGRDPLKETEADALWDVLAVCLGRLPELQREAFNLQEFQEGSSDEVALALGVKPNHLYVLLHRARLSIRQCLEALWFGGRAS
ncbi:hypothetical protein BI364_09575 [Acidihalobacter yilgarnensis]|uniref:RNA polymerase sigma factor n=1 Tax=Acidihalobacter yilgarnensis TaxID=2819280 RepID=A0A1D8IT07_9GAMM|nr:hypothetical protein BI364_09575 [Acidihalobacter yilgarnensis]